MSAFVVGQTVKLWDTHEGDGGWSMAYVESVHGNTYGVRVQGHSLYYVTADKLDTVQTVPEPFKPSVYGITVDYDYNATHKRKFLRVWSPPFFSVFEADGYSLPNGAGYMLTTYNGDKVRVTCPAPRNEHNWEEVDKAISDALNAHHTAKGTVTLSTYGSRADVDSQEAARHSS